MMNTAATSIRRYSNRDVLRSMASLYPDRRRHFSGGELVGEPVCLAIYEDDDVAPPQESSSEAERSWLRSLWAALVAKVARSDHRA